jgi:Dihydro-orotase-like
VPVGAVSNGLDEVELAELGLMARSRAGVRVFSDDGHCVSDARMMRRALEYVRAFDGVIAQHAHDPQLAGGAACCHEGEISGKLGLPGWPAAAEAAVVARDVQIAELTRSRLHICHVSCAETVDVIRWAKHRDISVTAEAAPHHLMLTTRTGPSTRWRPATHHMQRVTIAEFKIKLSSLRGDKVYLEGGVAHREKVISALRETVRAREAELITLRTRTTSRCTHMPKRVLAEHESVRVDLPAPATCGPTLRRRPWST